MVQASLDLRTRRRLGRAVAMVLVAGATVGSAHAQPIGVAIVPTAQWMDWSGRLPLQDDWMYGGRLALQFGSLFELQPFYFARNTQPLDRASVIALSGQRAANRTLDVSHYGASLQLNLGSGAIVPFVRGGGGILRFAPDSGEKRERIALSGGGGVRMGFGGFTVEAYAEQFGFRLDPRVLFGVDSLGTARRPTQRSAVYGGAVRIPLSAVPKSDTPSGGLMGTSFSLEPFAGRLIYDDKLDREDRNLIGASLGVDLSSIIGLRGFYWRGANEDRDRVGPVEGYGGELHLNLNAGPGVNPFLVTGAARIHQRDSAGTRNVAVAEDQDALILGAGATVRLTPRIGVVLSARDYIFARDNALDNVSRADDLTHNVLFSAGLSISLGGRSTAREPKATTRSTGDAPSRNDRSTPTADRDDRDDRDDRSARRAADTDRARGDNARDTARDSGQMRGGSGDRWITVPVPERGEIILRYGQYGPTRLIDTLRTGAVAMPDSLRDELARVAQELRLTRDLLTARVAELERARQEEAIARRNTVAAPLPPIVAPQTPAPAATPTTWPPTPRALDDDRFSGRSLSDRLQQLSSRDLVGVVGGSWSDNRNQAVASVRADLGPLTDGSALRVVPEFGVGVGEGSTSVLALINLRYTLGSSSSTTGIRPYVTGGFGIFSPSVFAINTAIGATFGLRADSPLYLYGELQGLNAFTHTRALVGLGLRR